MPLSIPQDDFYAHPPGYTGASDNLSSAKFHKTDRYAQKANQKKGKNVLWARKNPVRIRLLLETQFCPAVEGQRCVSVSGQYLLFQPKFYSELSNPFSLKSNTVKCLKFWSDLYTTSLEYEKPIGLNLVMGLHCCPPHWVASTNSPVIQGSRSINFLRVHLNRLIHTTCSISLFVSKISLDKACHIKEIMLVRKLQTTSNRKKTALVSIIIRLQC